MVYDKMLVESVVENLGGLETVFVVLGHVDVVEGFVLVHIPQIL